MLSIGQTLQNRYQILGLLGRGGMGVVYRAYDPVLQRTVAIKMLPPQLTLDAEFVTRFQREAIASANLSHPHIVTVYDVGQESGDYFIIMEYLEGSTLEQVLANSGPMSATRSSTILNQLAGALDHAHSRGIVHRDVKPSNIMLDVQDRAVLMDFGLVRSGEGFGPTRSSMVIGTPEYMAPEQVLGQAIDRRTDIYALGVVIYEMLSGKTPFAHTTPFATAHAHAYEAPPLLRTLNSAVPKSVEAVVTKALAKDPASRYQSAGDLAHDFSNAIGGTMPPGVAAALARPKPAAAAGDKKQSSSPASGVETVVMPLSASRPAVATTRQSRSKMGAFLVMGALATIGVVTAVVLWLRSDGIYSSLTPTEPPVAMAAVSTNTPTLRVVAVSPTSVPTATRVRTNTPTSTLSPTHAPTRMPTRAPTMTPTRTPTATPIPIEAILLSEDFEDEAVADWTTTIGTWTIEREDNNHYWQGIGPFDYPQTWYDSPRQWTDYAFEVRFRIMAKDKELFICVRSTEGNAFYVADLTTSGWYHLAVYDGSAYTVLKEKSETFLPSKWYLARIEIQDNNLRLYIDDKLLAAVEDNTLQSGSIGFYLRGGYSVGLDDMRVWSLSP